MNDVFKPENYHTCCERFCEPAIYRIENVRFKLSEQTLPRHSQRRWRYQPASRLFGFIAVLAVELLFSNQTNHMLEIGRMNRLRISRISQFSCFLDGGDRGEVTLIKGFQRADMQLGDSLDVFVYVDSDETVLATVHQPKVVAGQCAALRVVGSTDSGAYLDWDMSADLFVPRSELAESVTVGHLVVALGLVDDSNQRMIASTRLYKHLPQINTCEFESKQSVALLICQRTDLGFKAVIDGSHLGVLYHSEVFQSLSVGQSVKGFISPTQRDDGRIDLVLNLGNQASRDDLEHRILEHLQNAGGVSTLTDKSPPDEIHAAFSVSKGAYKKALGGLYRKKLITLDKHQVTLNQQ